jgi:hypothetical protein
MKEFEVILPFEPVAPIDSTRLLICGSDPVDERRVAAAGLSSGLKIVCPAGAGNSAMLAGILP